MSRLAQPTTPNRENDMIRTTTRSRVAAEAIRDAVPFTTSSPNFRGESYESGSVYLYWSSGRLDSLDKEAFDRDSRAGHIDYVVWSYSTPIAWRRLDGSWHIVAQRFSNTTSKHQGNLYLAGQRCVRPILRWCGMKGGVNQGYDVVNTSEYDNSVLAHGDTRDRAEYLARFIFLNGLPQG